MSKLDNPSAKRFIERSIGKKISPYNPLDESHKTFVKDARNNARPFVEDQIERLLTSELACKEANP